MQKFELDRLSRNPELAGSQELRGYWLKLRPGIRRSELETEARAAPRLGVRTWPIRTGLEEAREAMEFQQKTMGSSSKSAA